MTAEQRAALALLITSARACAEQSVTIGAISLHCAADEAAEYRSLVSALFNLEPDETFQPNTGSTCLVWRDGAFERAWLFYRKEGN